MPVEEDYEKYKGNSYFRYKLSQGEHLDDREIAEGNLPADFVARFNAAIDYAMQSRGAKTLRQTISDALVEKGVETETVPYSADDPTPVMQIK